MKELKNIKRLEAPGYLLTRIEGKLEEIKPIISFKLVAVYAAVLLCFILVQSNPLANENNQNDYGKEYAQELGLTTNQQLYHE